MKTAAEAWLRRLRYRLVALPTVQAWADAEIEKLHEPPNWLIAVSTARHVDDAIAALQEADGRADMAEVRAVLMRGWLELLNQGSDCHLEIAEALHGVGIADDPATAELRDELTEFWDAIDLAQTGARGSPEVERARLRDFLERHSRRS